MRQDLYYRLTVVRLHIPPLRERPEDIPLLVEHLVGRVASALAMQPKRVSADAMAVLARHEWPGNVRELGNVIQRACVLGRGPEVRADDLPEAIRDNAPETGSHFPTLQTVIRTHVDRALHESGGVRVRAARMLGVNRKHLWRMMRRYDISL